MLIKNYRFDVYGVFRLKIIVGSEEDLIKYYSKAFKEDNVKPFDGLSATDGTWLTILLDKDCKSETIAHEAFHLTRYMMEYIGSKLDDGSEEPWAYLLGDIVIKCEKTMELFKKKFGS